jgi:hypothetical protein
MLGHCFGLYWTTRFFDDNVVVAVAADLDDDVVGNGRQWILPHLLAPSADRLLFWAADEVVGAEWPATRPAINRDDEAIRVGRRVTMGLMVGIDLIGST